VHLPAVLLMLSDKGNTAARAFNRAQHNVRESAAVLCGTLNVASCCASMLLHCLRTAMLLVLHFCCICAGTAAVARITCGCAACSAIPACNSPIAAIAACLATARSSIHKQSCKARCCLLRNDVGGAAHSNLLLSGTQSTIDAERAPDPPAPVP